MEPAGNPIYFSQEEDNKDLAQEVQRYLRWLCSPSPVSGVVEYELVNCSFRG